MFKSIKQFDGNAAFCGKRKDEMMYLLPQKGKFYKANLHMHTTVSDGQETPEEVKAAYIKAGYSIVAFTDHEVLLCHDDLTDENFLAITSYEKSVNCPSNSSSFEYIKTAHLNLYATDSKNLDCPVLNPSAVWGNAKNYVTDEMKKYDYRATYSIDGLNELIKKANDAGFLVTLNHPVWSLQNHSDYSGLKGLWGIEVYNSCCVKEGFRDTVQPFEDLLREGNRIYPVASDDAHAPTDYFGGFVMVKAEKLDYKSVMTALKKGDFYASTGPEIYKLYLDGEKLVIECSSVVCVTVSTERRKTYTAKNKDGLNKAEFDISEILKSKIGKNGAQSYFRITIRDFEGNEAYTRAYFIDELVK